MTIDHIKPKSRGGPPMHEENMQPCCWFCNQLKGALTDTEFKKYLKTLYALYELGKIHIKFPENISLIFNQTCHPDLSSKQQVARTKENDRKIKDVSKEALPK